MSKQLTLSAALSIVAMVAFVLTSTPDRLLAHKTGAVAEAPAPAFSAALPTR